MSAKAVHRISLNIRHATFDFLLSLRPGRLTLTKNIRYEIMKLLFPARTPAIRRIQRLAGFKRPKRLIFVGDLPRNTMGKVQKAALRDQYKDLYQC